ncbi:hypothetical protein KSD_30030 [Ktedonobacter sp. SOSP1-85]|uniref:PglZ domain-containing protein n=1 Tax=Ktedonobacter sp. SOSP1-85 TaxID=2778367 RepID=UPI0019164599|nr:PglZ domain-containing protein [Ktedonobacter sp. SOSP1-85]GHO75232.1 hypothetical protein KSD_30030 [Ktedonobacter sp. SOSP1-85]
MITIYCDFYSILQVESTDEQDVVRRIQDYIPLRQRIRSALDKENTAYTVYVQNPILAQWLKDLRGYDPHIVRWEDIDPYAYFEQRFGFVPPVELSISAIQELLKVLPLPYEEVTADPTGWILSQRVDHVWGCSQPSENHLADVAAWMVRVKQIPVLLLPLMEARLAEWAKVDDRYKVFLDPSWKETARALLLRWALRFYPMTFSLRQRLEEFPLVDCNQYTDICIELFREKNNELRRFWHTWLISGSSPDISVALQQMSGLADAELDVIEDWARANALLVTGQLLEAIKNRFARFPRANNVLERLAKVVPPPVPPIPDPLWSSENWLRWVTEAYLPYFAWVIRNKQARDTQMKLAAQFEQWLLKIYPKFPSDPMAPFTPHQLSRIKELFDEKSVDVVFWFVVDGLTWWQGERLKSFCAERKVGGIYLEPTISALPTITSISKKALVSGYLESTDNTKPIAQIVRERLVSAVQNIHVYRHENELEEAFSSTLQPGLYTLMYNGLDHHSHDTQGFTDTESIDGHLVLLSRLIQEGFERCLRLNLRAKAFVSSDHGSTFLPKDARVLQLPKFAHSVDDSDLEGIPDEQTKASSRARACTSSRIPEKDELEEIKKDWHYLQKDVFSLPQQYFIPKAYSAVGRRPKGWTHGGATPEEVIVPFIALQTNKVEFLEPVINISGFLFSSKVNALQVTLGNMNPFPITVLQLLVADSTAKLIQSYVEPNAMITGEVILPAVVYRESARLVTWSLTCEGGGIRQVFRGDVSIPIRRLQTSDVDEMFEDML